MSSTDGPSEKRARHLMNLRALGITNIELMQAIERTPRENFVAPQWQNDLYTNRSLPIECGQDMTSATQVARTLHALNIEPPMRVLEIGTGTGYQTAILAQLSRQVVTVERYATLLDGAKQQLEHLGIGNVEYMLADGQEGVPRLGPYDCIVLNYSLPEIPRIFLEQMTMGARIIGAVGPADGRQSLTMMTKIGSRFEPVTLFDVMVAPAISGVAKAL
jgi:protein-L-isoaspartate(D-aspartate) O-methyltransferase